MHVYLDESGDMGWKFSSPYRAGGSSRFLCLAFLFLSKQYVKQPKRIIADLYNKYGWASEMKATNATQTQKHEFCAAVNQMLKTNPKIKIDCIIAKKENVRPHIRTDANKLYNYMCRLVMIDHIKHVAKCEFIPDKRAIKVESGNSLSDYLQIHLWFECNVETKILNNPQESHKNYNLQFVDWIASCVWSHFEDGETTIFNEINKNIRIRPLFF